MGACRVCEGSGNCQDDFHDGDAFDRTWDAVLHNTCPSCGKLIGQGRGNCAECGGSGKE
jgi:hypothetical protein